MLGYTLPLVTASALPYRSTIQVGDLPLSTLFCQAALPKSVSEQASEQMNARELG